MSVKGFTISKLIEAIRQANPQAVIDALDTDCDIEEADQHGQSGLPLRTACFSGKVEIVRELIRRGANVNAAGSDGPGMPLRLALRARNMEIAALLLASGAQVPPGITLPAELLAENRLDTSVRPEPPEIAPLEFTPAPKESTPADFLPEAPVEPVLAPASGNIEDYHVDEEVDITASYGLDTNVLTMDLLHFQEAQEKAAQTGATAATAENKKPGFWKSGHHA